MFLVNSGNTKLFYQVAWRKLDVILWLSRFSLWSLGYIIESVESLTNNVPVETLIEIGILSYFFIKFLLNVSHFVSQVLNFSFLLNVIAFNSDSAFLVNGLLSEHNLSCCRYFYFRCLALQNMSKCA